MFHILSLAIYKHTRGDGSEVLVPLSTVLDENQARKKRYELMDSFVGLSSEEFGVGYYTVARQRRTPDVKGLLSKLKEMFNYF